MVKHYESDSTQLVDLYLALAHLWRFDTALFVLQATDGKDALNKAEKNLIDLHDATNVHHGLNRQK